MATTPRRREARPLQLIARAALGAGIAALSLAVTVDQVFGAHSPAVAARWGSGAAVTDASRADRLAQPGLPPAAPVAPAALVEARRLSIDALGREPVNVPALRALAHVAAARGDLARADRLYLYAETLSRRDLLTQLWLIGERVRREDVPGALIHYDRALRTNGRARAALFPILVPGVAADPAVAAGVARLLGQRSAWGPDFLAVMAQDPNADPDVLGRLLLAAHLRPHVPAERGPLDAALARLVADGRYAPAHAAWAQAIGARRGPLVRNGGFEADPVLAPFDWSFADETDLSAVREGRGAGTVLVLRASGGGAGELARQLLVLRPGAYRLGLTTAGAGVDTIARGVVAVTCASGAELARLPLSAIDEARLTTRFTVPQGCAAQALTIAAPAGLGVSDGVTVDDIAIVPERG